MMDAKRIFFEVIWTHYYEISKELIPKELLEKLCDRITNYYYDQYRRFGIQYPKSIKRYSSFQLKDLDHPDTFEMVIKFFKEELGNNYPEFSRLLLNMTDFELKKFEKNREDFYNK